MRKENEPAVSEKELAERLEVVRDIDQRCRDDDDRTMTYAVRCELMEALFPHIEKRHRQYGSFSEYPEIRG